MRFHSSRWRYASWRRLTLGLVLALLIGIAGSLPVEASMSFDILAKATPTPTSTPTTKPTITTTPTTTPTRTRTPWASPTPLYLFLPLLLKPMPLPGAAILNAISNADGDANYIISWGPAARAQTYELQEDDNASFSSPTRRYSGADTSYAVSGQTAGTWYYRVRGCHTGGCGSWSNTQSVNVTSCPYADDFSNPSSGWPVGDKPGEYRVEYLDGEYRILVRPTTWCVRSPSPFSCTNCSVEADGRFASEIYGSYGILFGITEDWDFYLFQVDGAQEYNLLKWQGGWYTLVPWTYSDHINPGQTPNHLRVIRNGSQIALYVNGHLLTTVTDSSFTGNLRVGLAAVAYAQSDVDARFDNFRICPAMAGAALMSALPAKSEVRSGEAGSRP